MKDIEVERNTLKQFLKNWYKLRNNEQKTCKKNCFVVPPPPTIPPHITITYIHTYT
jgi:hypothetical protein